jgi:hypothetical protein
MHISDAFNTTFMLTTTRKTLSGYPVIAKRYTRRDAKLELV